MLNKKVMGQNSELQTLKTLKDNTAAGFNEITVKLLKIIIIISVPLLYIYNLSSKYCLFPGK